MKLPKISIVIPSYNSVLYIEGTLKSIASQKYPNLEVIIQDGGSTDGTLDLIEKFANKYSKIINYESKKDNGQVDAINKGLKKATGDILTYINSDDIYKKDALLTVGKYFSNKPKTLWLAGRGEIMDRKGNIRWNSSTSYKNYLLNKNKYCHLLMVNYLMQPSVFLSKEAYKKYGPFTGTKKFVMEYDLWLKIGKDSMPRVINKTLSVFRLSGKNISSLAFKNTLKEDFKIVKNYTNDPIVLTLHELHNIARVIMISLVK
jgi:glycosyltransferase involved in cell wall biosynthesis